MLTFEPGGAVLGAVARGIDPAQLLNRRDMGAILLALGRHGVLRFPDQHLGLGELKRSHGHLRVKGLDFSNSCFNSAGCISIQV